MRKRLFFALLGVMSVSCGAYADEFEFCHVDDTGAPEWYGTGKRDTYDVAIRISDAGLAGYRIVGVKVPFRGVEYVSGLKGWLSTDLVLGKDENDRKVNVPDITSAAMEYSDGWLTAMFDTPYELTADGVYAGYTFTVDDIATDESMRAPVAVRPGKDADALYLHTNRTYMSWKECSSSTRKKSCITLLLEGEMPRSAVGLKMGDVVYVTAGEESVPVPVEFVMHGSEPLGSVGVSYEVTGPGGPVGSGSLAMDFDMPVALGFGHVCQAELRLPESLPKGAYGVSLTVTDVNGKTNHDATATAVTSLEALSQVPVHRPLMEEYTGLWCGNCPRGYASMEHMSHKYPDDFIAIAYHNGDDMHCVQTYPSAVPGFPAGWLDRTVKLDPYLGQAEAGYGFELDWLDARARFTPVAVEVSAAFDDSDADLIEVECEVSLVRSSDTEYKVAYALLADGLQDAEWSQSNYFAGAAGYDDIEEMGMFVNGTRSMKGLVYNDVIVSHSPLEGVDGSLPAVMEVDRKYAHGHSFRVSGCTNMKGDVVVRDRSKLRVVAMVVGADGSIANAAVAPVGTGVGSVCGVDGDMQVVSTVYYDICGNVVINPARGIYVRVDRLSDGSLKAAKVSMP